MLQFGLEYSNTPILLAILCFVTTLFILFGKRKNIKLPRGPIGLPIVGYLPFLTDMPHLKFTKLASKYGNIFSLRLGGTYVVVLNKARTIREAFSKPELLGRPPITVFNAAHAFESPFLINGKVWQEQRRFALQNLRDSGFGKSQMENHIMDEIECILEVIKKTEGMPVNIKEKLTPSISNNICSLGFGSRYNYDDPERLFLDEILETVSLALRQLAPVVFFPWLAKLPFSYKILKHDKLGQKFGELAGFLNEHIDQHEKTLDPDNTRDYIDGYLLEMKQRLQKDPDTTFSRGMLTGALINFFGAGSEPTRTTLDWCLYTVAAFPDVQNKVKAEIDSVIGRETTPSWMCHKDMPFTRAVIMEVQRWKTVVPINLLRYTLADTEIGGYYIPKGTTVVANLFSAHQDPDEWENPSEFRPSRFLSKDGKTVLQPNGFMPFSTGKRSCPGKILAKIEVFLYFTSILQRFNVELPEKTAVSFEAELGITYRMKPHELCFKDRVTSELP